MAPESLARELRDRGMRLTPQRETVLQAVRARGRATADQIADECHASGHPLSTTTVYRALELLEQIGLIQHAHMGHGPPVYFPAEEYTAVRLICHRCGDVISASTQLLDTVARRVKDEFGFRLDPSHVGLSGICGPCEIEVRQAGEATISDEEGAV